MRAWILERHGSPDAAFALKERKDPVPGPGQLLIRSEGFGLNYADVMARKGLYRDAPPPPCVIGYETVGVVEALGPNVPGSFLGRRVAAITRFGGYAEKVVTDHRAVVFVPGNMGVGEACGLMTQGATAWYMAMIAAPLRPGQRVMVHSAAGGVGHLLVRMAVHRGCEVFAVAGGQEKVAFLRDLGAHHVIDRLERPYDEAVRQQLQDDRLDVSFNAVGGSSFKKDMKLIGHGGALVIYGGAERGSAKGPLGTLAFVWRMGVVIPITLMMSSRSIIGVNMLRIGEHKPQLLAESLKGVMDAAEAGWLTPRVHPLFNVEQLPQAHALLESGRSIGKLAVRW